MEQGKMVAQQGNGSGASAPPPSASQPTSAIGGTGGLAHPVGLVGFLTAVVGLEFGAVWFLLSRHSPGELASASAPAGASTNSVATMEVIPNPPLLNGDNPTSDGVEVDLGEFTISSYRLSSGTTLRLDFHLYGIVNQKLEEKFKQIWPRHVHRFRETVITTIRGAPPSELADPSLALIKRQILEKSNRLFAKEFLQGLVVSDFSLVEQ